VRGIVLSPEEKLSTAYHESGHALLGMLTPGADPVRRVTIIPRGQALGVTLQTPQADRYGYSEKYLRGRIAGALGGRAAEEIVYGEVTTGAESDLDQATRLARQMVGRWGMSPAIGPVSVLAMPVGDEDGMIGVVEALVSWEPIRREFADEARRDVRATLVDRHGRILFPVRRAGGERRHSSSLVSDFERFPARVTRSEMQPGQSVLASIAPVGRPEWGVLLERDLAAAFASVDRMVEDTLLWSAAALAGALLLGLISARRLSRPITQLAESTRAVSECQYGVSVKVTGTAELADLSENFNRMSESIRDAIENLKRAARENHELFINSIRALAAAIDAKDPYTRGHSERVARYASQVAREMGLTPEDVRRVRLSALLHDVGKIGIDDQILRKPTALTEEEFEIMKSHPTKGAAIMETIPQLRDVIPGMKHHHERWEGGGYPDGLQGEGIPLQARIVSVADTFDAMTTTRPYQRAMDIRFVFQRLRDLAGNRFDPSIVEALIRSYEKGELVPIAREEAPPEVAATPLRRVEAS